MAELPKDALFFGVLGLLNGQISCLLISPPNHLFYHADVQRLQIRILEKEGDKRMPTYISLLKLTEQGIKNIKDAPARVEQAIKAMEAGAGKFIGFYAVMGEYDYVVIAEAPNDEAMMTYLLALGSLGNVKTSTMKAFTKEQFADLVKKLP